jgi:hypothetical protein
VTYVAPARWPLTAVHITRDNSRTLSGQPHGPGVQDVCPCGSQTGDPQVSAEPPYSLPAIVRGCGRKHRGVCWAERFQRWSQPGAWISEEYRDGSWYRLGPDGRVPKPCPGDRS